MDFDFFFKLIITCSFFGISICLCVKWIVESYLDYIQVKTGIQVMTHTQLKDLENLIKKDNDDDPFAH
jgi:hypothetical protein